MNTGILKKNRINVADSLSGSTLFAYFTPDELVHVAEMIKVHGYAKGELIFSEGDVGEELYIIATGKVAIGKRVKGNLEQVLAHLGRGECFGEMAILEKIPRTASAHSEEDCMLMALSKDHLFSLMETDPRAAAKIMFNLLKTFNTRLQTTNDHLREAVRWGLEATGFQPES